MTANRIVSVVLLAFVFVACSDEDDSMPRRPQIVPHINPVNICQIEMPEPNTTCALDDPAQACERGSCSCATDPCICIPRKATADVMIFNRGQERLDITNFEVIGDRRCAFEPPGGDILLYDNDETDEFAATVRSREAAFLRVQYSPPAEGDDEVIIKVHSNAENFPEPEGLDIFVCAAGVQGRNIHCRIRLDPECEDSSANAYTCTPGLESQGVDQCPSFCASGEECVPPTLEDPIGVPCSDGELCRSPYYCVENEGDPRSGTCFCRPCAVPPDAGWDDCSAG